MEYKLYGDVITFNEGQVNQYKINKRFLKMAQDVGREYDIAFKSCGNLKGVVDNFAGKLMEVIQKNIFTKAREYLIENKIYTMNEKKLAELSSEHIEEVFYACSEYEYWYDVIMEKKEMAAEYRRERKDNRSRMTGIGLGMTGAISAAAQAGVVNTVTGLGHSAYNAIGNISTNIQVSEKMKEIVDDYDIMCNIITKISQLMDNVKVACIGVLMTEAKISFEVIDDRNVEKAKAIYENIIENRIAENEIKECIVKGLQLNPFDEKLYQLAIIKYGDEDKVIEKITDAIGYDIKEFKKELDKEERTYKGVVYDSIESKESFIKEEADREKRTYNDIVFDSINEMEEYKHNEKEMQILKTEYTEILSKIKDINVNNVQVNIIDVIYDNFEKEKYKYVDWNIIHKVLEDIKSIIVTNDMNVLSNYKMSLEHSTLINQEELDKMYKEVVYDHIYSRVQGIFPKEYGIYQKYEGDMVEPGKEIFDLIVGTLFFVGIGYWLSNVFDKLWILILSFVLCGFAWVDMVGKIIHTIKYKKIIEKMNDLRKIGLIK